MTKREAKRLVYDMMCAHIESDKANLYGYVVEDANGMQRSFKDIAKIDAVLDDLWREFCRRAG